MKSIDWDKEIVRPGGFCMFYLVFSIQSIKARNDQKQNKRQLTPNTDEHSQQQQQQKVKQNDILVRIRTNC